MDDSNIFIKEIAGKQSIEKAFYIWSKVNKILLLMELLSKHRAEDIIMHRVKYRKECSYENKLSL